MFAISMCMHYMFICIYKCFFFFGYMSNTGGSKQVVTMGASFVNFLYIFFGSMSLFFL